MQQQPEQVKEERAQRVRRWGRKKEEERAESAAYVAAPTIPLHRPYSPADRFQPAGLRPADEAQRTWQQLRSRLPSRRIGKRLGEWLRPTRALDKVLLGIELVGALVVAWVVWQYLYTTYIDTGPKRLTPSRAAITPTGSGGALPGNVAPTPTRFIEVAPPIEGGPDDEAGPVTGGPGAGATPSLTPAIPIEFRLPTRLRIPAMFLDSPIEEVKINMGEWEVSPMDIGHHEGTGVPGETGNVVLAGHRDINSALFRDLDRLGPGDEVFVSNALGEHRYVVSEMMEVSPDHIEVMDPTDDKRVTLITCTPPGIATRRLIVVAILDGGGP